MVQGYLFSLTRRCWCNGDAKGIFGGALPIVIVVRGVRVEEAHDGSWRWQGGRVMNNVVRHPVGSLYELVQSIRLAANKVVSNSPFMHA